MAPLKFLHRIHVLSTYCKCLDCSSKNCSTFHWMLRLVASIPFFCNMASHAQLGQLIKEGPNVWFAARELKTRTSCSKETILSARSPSVVNS